MSRKEDSNYSDIDYLLEQKEEELRELGAMRVRALEKANEELKEQVDQYSALLHSTEEENDRLKSHLSHLGFHREEFESRIYKLNEILQNKDIEISELKTSINTYYTDLTKEKKRSHECKQEIVSLLNMQNIRILISSLFSSNSKQ
jgi:chromosome segregation ATPase